MKFEIYDGDVIYTNGATGGVLVPAMGYWHPFSFFDNGNLDISEEFNFTTPIAAASKANDIYT